MNQRCLFCLFLLLAPPGLFAAEESKPEQLRFRVTGLFQKDREADLRATIATIPDVKLLAIDFAAGEAKFEFDPAKLLNKPKGAELVERFDSLIATNSNRTFGIRALPTIDRAKLEKVEIPVIGLDCKACCWATYQAVYKIDGVEQATASYREGLVTALIDPAKTNRAALEDALKQKGVKLKDGM